MRGAAPGCRGRDGGGRRGARENESSAVPARGCNQLQSGGGDDGDDGDDGARASERAVKPGRNFDCEFSPTRERGLSLALGGRLRWAGADQQTGDAAGGFASPGRQ